LGGIKNESPGKSVCPPLKEQEGKWVGGKNKRKGPMFWELGTVVMPFLRSLHFKYPRNDFSHRKKDTWVKVIKKPQKRRIGTARDIQEKVIGHSFGWR